MKRTRHAWMAAAVLMAWATLGCAKDNQPETFNRAYVLAEHSNELFSINLQTCQVVGKALTAPAPHQVNFDRDVRFLSVSGTGGNVVNIFRATDLVKVADVPVGLEPEHHEVTLDNRYEFFGNMGSDEVSILDIATHTEIARLGGFNGPHNIDFSADGSYAYVTNFRGHRVSVLDVAALKVVKEIPVGNFGLDAIEEEETGVVDLVTDKEAHRGYAVDRQGFVLVFDTKTNEAIKTLAVGREPWGPFDYAPFTGPFLATGNWTSRDLSIIDRGPGEVVARVSLDSTGSVRQHPARVESSLDAPEVFGVNIVAGGEKAYVMNRTLGVIQVVNLLTNTVVKEIEVGGQPETASTTADGRQVWAAVSGGNRVVVIDVATDGIACTVEGLGEGTWAIHIPEGVNYCH